jgi:FkbM family methyltransferase
MLTAAEAAVNPIARAIRSVRKALPAPDVSRRRMKGGYWLDLKPAADSLEKRIYIDRGYEPATLHLFDQLLRPGDAMIDVGANIGVMSLHAATCVGGAGLVLSIEPHPQHYQRLVRNISLNAVSNIKAVNVALGEEPERRPIFDLSDENGGSASLVDAGDARVEVGAVEVERLDDLASEIGGRPLRLIKIDVEGFELPVLRGAPRTLARGAVICMEVDPSMPTAEGDALAAHRCVMATGLYDSYRFQKSKFAASPLVPLIDADALPRGAPDNVIYIPRANRAALPGSLFAL